MKKIVTFSKKICCAHRHKKAGRKQYLPAVMQNLPAHLSAAVNQIFAAGQFGQSHGSSGMQFLRTNANFSAETELKAVRKAGRSIDVNRRS